MSKSSSAKPETHYGLFLAVLGIVALGIFVFYGIYYLTTVSNQVKKLETEKIQNFNCSQLWIEDDYMYQNHYGSVEDNVARDKYHEQCLKPLFLDAFPNEDQQDAYFLSVSCQDLKSWMIEQKPYFERAIIDYKEMCKQ